MQPFLDENCLLSNETARLMYTEAAESLPLIDYHSRLSALDIARNTKFRNLTQLMLKGDPACQRLMLMSGAEERLIAGDGEDREKFMAFASALPHAMGNPLYLLIHLALKRLFGVDIPLDAASAGEIYDYAGALLQQDDFRMQRFIDRFHVKILCTEEEPAASLSFHHALAAEGKMEARVLPAFSPDRAVNVQGTGFAEAIRLLSRAANMPIRCAVDVLTALERRMDYFHACGCRLAVHALDRVPQGEASLKKADKAFAAAMEGEKVKGKLGECYRTVVLSGLGALYAQRGWAQEYAIHPLPGSTVYGHRQFGPGGFLAAADEPYASALASLLDLQEMQGQLPKTILSCPSAQSAFGAASLLGSFGAPGIRGKIQLGMAGKMQEGKGSLEEKLHLLSSLGSLGASIGTASESPSIAGLARHEYFRRVLCNCLGEGAEMGEYPKDQAFLQKIVKNICFDNAQNYFGFDTSK